MDFVKLGAGVVLILTFAGALLAGNRTPSAPVDALDLAICGTDRGTHGAEDMDAHLSMMAAGADAGHAALIDTMGPMHTDMMRGLAASSFDAAFLCSMIPHHQGAIDMARVALTHGEDPFVTMMAHQIIVDQEREIGEMTRWLERRQAMGID